MFMESRNPIRTWLLSVLLTVGMSLPMLQAIGQCACTGSGPQGQSTTALDGSDACDDCCDSEPASPSDNERDHDCPVDQTCPKPCCATTVTPVTTRPSLGSPFIAQLSGHVRLFIVISPAQDVQFDLLRPPRA